MKVRFNLQPTIPFRLGQYLEVGDHILILEKHKNRGMTVLTPYGVFWVPATSYPYFTHDELA